MSRVVSISKRLTNVTVGRREKHRSPFPDLRDVVLEEVAPPAAALAAFGGRELPLVATEETPEALSRIDEETLARVANEQFQRGLKEGERRGLDQVRDAVERALTQERDGRKNDAVARLDHLTESLSRQLQQLQVKAEEAVVKLALSIAEQIVKREVRLDNAIIIQQIREALHRIVGVEHVKVRVHPDDEAMIRAHRTAVMTGSDTLRDLVIEADPSIDPGGCIVESDSGNVDARLSTQMKKIESLFLDQNVVS